MTPGPWTYPPELQGALAVFGLAPGANTPPVFVRTALHNLYRYELRRLRDQYLAGSIVKPAYLESVVTLRKKYWPLTLPPEAWEKICGTDSVP